MYGDEEKQDFTLESINSAVNVNLVADLFFFLILQYLVVN